MASACARALREMLLAGLVPVLLIVPGRARAAGEVVESHRIQLENREGGAIRVSRDSGATWAVLGHVLRPDDGVIHEIGDREFTAADWAPMCAVAATAVNAIHIKLDQKEHASALTIQPLELLTKEKADQVASYLARDASIYTDVPAGTGLFAELAPFVGDPVEVVHDGHASRAPRGYAPKPGDVLQIRVMRPARMPDWIDFENRFGGAVLAHFPDGELQRIAVVHRPVTGVGRFGGTQYAGTGEIRANHPGVICVSTCPPGEVGGFQIVPSVHASGPALDYVRAKSVWMVVGPATPERPDLEGTFPLFSGVLRPRLGHVQVRLSSGSWVEVPEISGLKETKLMTVSHVRIYPEGLPGTPN